MRTRIGTSTLSAALALALSGLSHAAIEKSGVGGAETIQCHGQAVQVNGMSQDLTLLGECPDVQVNGTGNTVRIELAGTIQVNGTNNKVTWGAGISGRPQIENSGTGNSVRQAAVAGAARSGASASTARRGNESVTISGHGDSVTIDTQHRGRGDSVTIASGTGDSVTIGANRSTGRRGADINVTGNHRSETFDCGGRDASIDGDHNDITLTGECGSVSVDGNHNSVSVEAVAAVSANGNHNNVTWSRGVGGRSPRISNLGNRNSVTRAGE
jgi:hypothetical protein